MTNPLKILLVHLYSNGDCLYATTIARQIKQDYPRCHLTWAIASFCKTIIANNPYVDEIMEVNNIKKDDVAAFRKLRKELKSYTKNGKFDKIFITHNMDTNLAYYDGSIRSGIFRSYRKKITVPIQPVLKLYDEEIKHAAEFAEMHQLQNYEHIILFEYAPQSRQLNITKEFAISVAEKLAVNKNVAVIMSAGQSLSHPLKNIIDGSRLTFRETASLTHYCTLLLGCSSGITWISTSSAGKLLPMVQLINPDAAWLNPVSRDFERFGLDVNRVIELTSMNENDLVSCVRESFVDFTSARKKYNKEIKENFKTTSKIIYNLLCYLELPAIIKHIQINREVYGDKILFYKQVVIGIITAPFILVKNIFVKKIYVN